MKNLFSPSTQTQRNQRTGYTQPHFLSLTEKFFQRVEIIDIPKKMNYLKSGAGYTLVELMITIAIVGLLAAITFGGLSQGKSRGAARQAADQVQIDLQGLQNYQQSGVVAPKNSCVGGTNDHHVCTVSGDCNSTICQAQPPTGYGVIFAANATRYITYADMDQPSDPPSVLGDNDDIVLSTKTLGSNITVKTITYNIKDNTGTFTSNNLRVIYDSNNGDVTLRDTSTNNIAISATVVLKHSKLNVCYDVTIQSNSGIVSKRQLEASSC